MSSALHVVFGAGQVGAQLARRLQAAGHRVRVVRRSDKPVGDGIEVVAGDARDAAFAARAAEGAAVVYHCMNPSAYTAKAWREEFPALGDALIAAAVGASARLVVLDNLYAYGPTEARLREDTEMKPSGPKGLVRRRWAERLAEAARTQGLRYVVGKAGDFFGPGAEGSLVSEDAVRGLARGKRPILLGDVHATHAFSYIPDVVVALAALGEAEGDVEGTVFHLPVIEVAPEDLYLRIAAALGVRTRPRRAARALIVGLSPFVALFRELRETLYQWEQPFLVDDSRFRARFPRLGATLDEAVRGTADIARTSASASASASELRTA